MIEKKISVIIPTFNASHTIDRCLDSIVNQTYSNLEIICCDDFSDDNTVEKLEQWAKYDNRIKVLKNKYNKKSAYTRNKCIEYSTGEYIAQLDDDDYCVLDRIEKQVEFLNNNSQYAFVGTSVKLFDESGVWGKAEWNEKPGKEDFLWNSCFYNPSVMFRKSALEKVNGYRVAKETRRSQDYDLFMRLYAQDLIGYNMEEPLTFYYRGRKSIPKSKYKYRVDEAKIRYKNFKDLGLLPKGAAYILKPLILGLIPMSWLEKMKKRLLYAKD